MALGSFVSNTWVNMWRRVWVIQQRRIWCHYNGELGLLMGVHDAEKHCVNSSILVWHWTSPNQSSIWLELQQVDIKVPHSSLISLWMWSFWLNWANALLKGLFFLFCICVPCVYVAFWFSEGSCTIILTRVALKLCSQLQNHSWLNKCNLVKSP